MRSQTGFNSVHNFPQMVFYCFGSYPQNIGNLRIGSAFFPGHDINGLFLRGKFIDNPVYDAFIFGQQHPGLNLFILGRSIFPYFLPGRLSPERITHVIISKVPCDRKHKRGESKGFNGFPFLPDLNEDLLNHFICHII